MIYLLWLKFAVDLLSLGFLASTGTLALVNFFFSAKAFAASAKRVAARKGSKIVIRKVILTSLYRGYRSIMYNYNLFLLKIGNKIFSFTLIC